MHIDVFEWNVVGVIEAEHNHATDPLEEEVGACFHNASWIVLLAIAGGDVWPLARAEPGIEGVFVAAVGFAVFGDF